MLPSSTVSFNGKSPQEGKKRNFLGKLTSGNFFKKNKNNKEKNSTDTLQLSAPPTQANTPPPSSTPKRSPSVRSLSSETKAGPSSSKPQQYPPDTLPGSVASASNTSAKVSINTKRVDREDLSRFLKGLGKDNYTGKMRHNPFEITIPGMTQEKADAIVLSLLPPLNQ